jgi:hypothetical protein
LLGAGEHTHDQASRSNRRDAHGDLLGHVRFFVLQHPDIALSGSAIDPNRLLERLFLLLELRGASRDDNS